MTFVQSLRCAFGLRSLAWSYLWLVVPIINVLTSFVFVGFIVKVVHACQQKRFDPRYAEHGWLFLRGVFAMIIVLAYVLPGVVVMYFHIWTGLVLLILGSLFGWAGLVNFGLTERVLSAFGPSAWRLLLQLRFWLAMIVAGIFALASGLLIGSVMWVTRITIVVPVLLMALWIVVNMSVLAALSGHAAN